MSQASAPRPPETILQFGTGAFLRGFLADIVDAANRRGAGVGSIVAVGSTASSRAEALNAQRGEFILRERGMERGTVVDRQRVIRSIRRALSAEADWSAVLDVARSPHLRLVVSNTTEVGIVCDAADRFGPGPPRSFPGKVTRILFERATAFDFDAARGVVVLPCELIEQNGTRLREIVLEHAARWNLDPRFAEWLTAGTVFCDTLVDRIVTGAPDNLITVCEPYRLFAIQGDASLQHRLPFAAGDDTIVVTDDIAPFRTRKLRLLNGTHTITASAALRAGIETVHDAVADPELGAFIRRVLLEEIVPGLDVAGAEVFAHEVLERFANPFIRHRLADIVLHHVAKMRIRVVPSIRAFADRFGRAPDRIAQGFAAFLAEPRHEFTVDHRAGIHDFVRAVCADEALWQTDLTQVTGFVDAVAGHLTNLAAHT